MAGYEVRIRFGMDKLRLNVRKKGFTLIELLVVISIIALLLAILMPALGRVKELGRSAVCRANERTMVLAWVLYAGDNDDRMCSSWTYDQINGWGNTWDWVWGPYKLDGTGSADEWDATEEERREGIKRGAIYKYSEDTDAFHCPSDKNKQSSGKFRTYSIPDSMGGLWTHFWPVVEKMSQIKRPSAKYVIVEEDDDRGYNMNSWILSPKQGGGVSETIWNDPYLTVWHNGSSNLAFADGHVDSRKWSKESFDYFSIEKFDQSWGSFSPATSGGKEDLEWMAKSWAK